MRSISYCVLIVIGAYLLSSCKTTAKVAEQQESEPDPIHKSEEKHFSSVRQMTYHGDNAEAYWNSDGTQLVFQATNERWGISCDQIYVVDADYEQRDGEIPPMVSTGNGRTTCAYFLPSDDEILYASTHGGHTDCPVAPPRVIGGKYVWPIYAEYDIYTAGLDGNVRKQLTDTPGYDAEATISPDGKRVVFTSLRSGDLDLYTMNIDGSDVQRVTYDLGYDGGAFFSPDSKKIVFRAGRPRDTDEANAYKYLLTQNMIEPTDMEIYMCNADGSNLRQLTDLGGANWAPYFHPDGDKILFASNHHSGDSGFPFNIFMIDTLGGNLEQVTYGKKFDSFPMFSPDGSKLAFSSNRNNGGTRSTNVFIAEWQD